MNLIQNYFPNLSELQISQYQQLKGLYEEWNAKINVISRKDIDALYLKHVLHSLGIAKVVEFQHKSNILDVGTGGGFPGIPLAIMFPESNFHLVDSINKKLKVVDGIADALGLSNIKTTHNRVEVIDGTYDFIVSRAVTTMPTFVAWVKGKISKKQNHELKNGILYLKGGDLTEELKIYQTATVFDLGDYFKEDFLQPKSGAFAT